MEGRAEEGRAGEDRRRWWDEDRELRSNGDPVAVGDRHERGVEFLCVGEAA